jgi:hypothetical protein
MTPKRRNIIIGITIVIIIAIVLAMINTASSDTNTSTSNEGGLFTNLINGNTPTNDSITLDYYETMINVITTSAPYPTDQHGTYSDYPKKGYFETLNPVFYSGDRYEFDNVVNKRMLGIIAMKKPEYLINGDVTEPGALIDAYVEVKGSLYIEELTDLFNDFKAEYLKTV